MILKFPNLQRSPEGQGNIGYDTPGAAAVLVPPIANNGLSVTAGVIQLGGLVGSPSLLLNQREIGLNGFLLQIDFPGRTGTWQFVDNNDGFVQVNINFNTFCRFDMTNANAGNSARIGWRAINDLGHTANWSISSSTYASNNFFADTAFLEGVNCAALSIGVRTGVIVFNTGGLPILSTIRGLINNAGNWIIGNLGTLSPTDNGSTLQIIGTFAPPLRSTAVNATLGATDYTLILTAGALTITIPAAGATNKNRIYVISNKAASSTLSTTYINDTGASTSTLNANSSTVLQSDGTNWQQIN